MSQPPLSIVPVFLALGLHVAGCAAPLSSEAQCFARATDAYREVWRAAEAARTDLDRGYTLHRVETARVAAVPCRVDGRRSTCLADARDDLSLPVAVDRAEIRHRLDALEARLAALRPAAMARAAPCGYGDWAGTIAGGPSS